MINCFSSDQFLVMVLQSEIVDITYMFVVRLKLVCRGQNSYRRRVQITTNWTSSFWETRQGSLTFCRRMCLPMALDNESSASTCGSTQQPTITLMACFGIIVKLCTLLTSFHHFLTVLQVTISKPSNICKSEF